MQFKDLKIIPEILKALADENYDIPTDIQEQAIPSILEGRDLLGCAQTGTGKTAAFAIPTLQLLNGRDNGKTDPRKIRTLILTPTRELAIQISESFSAYGKYLSLRCDVIFGGVSQKPQEKILRNGIDVLVATPGRLKDLINQKLVDLKNVEILILDEADRMLDMGFIHDVKNIISHTPREKQTLFFSATMPPEVANMVKSMLVNPVTVKVTPESTTVDAIKQSVYFVDKCNKKNLLLHLLKDKSIDSVLIFTRTKHGADRLAKELMSENISAQAIHGDKSQNGRQMALSNFKSKVTKILVATDIAARGIDINELSHVVNYDIPNIPETYVHRIGRTGRAGFSGIAISFCDFEEKAFLMDIEKLIGKRVPVVKEHPFPLQIMEILPKAVRQPRAPRELGNTQRVSKDKKPKSDFTGEKSPYAKSKSRVKNAGGGAKKPRAHTWGDAPKSIGEPSRHKKAFRKG